MFKEFKKFIAKGNVMDLAVAVIIGAALPLNAQNAPVGRVVVVSVLM